MSEIQQWKRTEDSKIREKQLGKGNEGYEKIVRKLRGLFYYCFVLFCLFGFMTKHR